MSPEEALIEFAKFGEYLWRQGGYVPARGISKKIRDVLRAIGEEHVKKMTAEAEQATLVAWFGIHEFRTRPAGSELDPLLCVKCDQPELNPIHTTRKES